MQPTKHGLIHASCLLRLALGKERVNRDDFIRLERTYDDGGTRRNAVDPTYGKVKTLFLLLIFFFDDIPSRSRRRRHDDDRHIELIKSQKDARPYRTRLSIASTALFYILGLLSPRHSGFTRRVRTVLWKMTNDDDDVIACRGRLCIGNAPAEL
mmetsp:Transcript_18180/g.37976  ORF Transcript_18180/g.37976 Transcript_18180/m.37976 type:complete len:154 (+) Transcript_18180:288-749(+)